MKIKIKSCAMYKTEFSTPASGPSGPRGVEGPEMKLYNNFSFCFL